MSNGRRIEHQHNSHEQVTGYLDDALVIVRDLDVPEVLLPIAFAKAIDLLAAKQIVVEQIAPGAGGMFLPGPH